MQQTLPVSMAVFVLLEGTVGVREGWRCAREGFGGLYVVEEGGTSMMLKLCADSWDSKTQVRYLYAASDTTQGFIQNPGKGGISPPPLTSVSPPKNH